MKKRVLASLYVGLVAGISIPAGAQKLEAEAAIAALQDGKLFLEANMLPEAEAKLTLALKMDPSNDAARHYLSVLQNRRYAIAAEEGEAQRRTNLFALESRNGWTLPVKRILNIPNQHFQTNRTHCTTKARQSIHFKLDTIRIDELVSDSLPLGQVVESLSKEAKNRDPNKKGLNFIRRPATLSRPQGILSVQWQGSRTADGAATRARTPVAATR